MRSPNNEPTPDPNNIFSEETPFEELNKVLLYGNELISKMPFLAFTYNSLVTV